MLPKVAAGAKFVFDADMMRMVVDLIEEKNAEMEAK